MKKLSDQDIIRIMREEWDAKLAALSETIDAVMKGKIDGEEKTLISKDLKVRHKKSQILYTVVSVGPRDVVMRTPEGKEILINKAEMEKDYEID